MSSVFFAFIFTFWYGVTARASETGVNRGHESNAGVSHQCGRDDVKCTVNSQPSPNARKGGRALLQHPEMGLVGTGRYVRHLGEADGENVGSHLGEDSHDSSSDRGSDKAADEKQEHDSEVDVGSLLDHYERQELTIAVGCLATASAVQRASAYSEQMQRHQVGLLRSLRALHATIPAANQQLDTMASKFIDNQAADQDKCGSQLVDAKKQLGDVITNVQDLGGQVNATEVQIQATTMELQQVHDDMTAVENHKNAELKKVAATQAENEKMLETLKEEMAEMQTMANPTVQQQVPAPMPMPPPPVPFPPPPAPVAMCQCSTPGQGTAGKNQYTCDDGQTAYCRASEQCYNTGTWAFGTPSSSFCAAMCRCSTPNQGTAGKNQYTCDDGQTGYCAATDQCFNTGTWSAGTKSSSFCSPAAASLIRARSFAPNPSPNRLSPHPSPMTSSLGVHSRGKVARHKPRATSSIARRHQAVDFLQEATSLERKPKAPKQPNPAQVKSAMQLAAQTRNLVKDLMSCVAGEKYTPTALVDLSLFGGANKSHAIGDCAGGTTPVTLTLDGSQQHFYLSSTIRNGEQMSYKCQEINPSYHGRIWLKCHDGIAGADDVHCFATEPKTTGTVAQPTPSEAHCAKERHNLVTTYSKAYTELSRQLSEFEDLTHSTASVDAVTQTSEQRMKPLQSKVSSLSSSLTELNNNLQSFRPRMEDASTAESSLRTQITEIQKKCDTMEDTVESLDKVRDTIHALEGCPTTDQPRFEIPVWVGKWVTSNFNLVEKSDEEVDQAMHALCATLQVQGENVPRAAETSEIEQKTAEGAPLQNTASVPLMGTCPNCEGAEDAMGGQSHKSGHSRICWDPGADLTDVSRREDCGSGKKAVLCVTDGDSDSGSDEGLSS